MKASNCSEVKLLSVVGKEVLLKAVPQAHPNYVMSIFKLPKKVCKKLMAIMLVGVQKRN